MRAAAPSGLFGVRRVIPCSAPPALDDDGTRRELLRRGRGGQLCLAVDADWRRSRGRVAGPEATESKARRPLLTPTVASVAVPRARSGYRRGRHLPFFFRSPAVPSALLHFHASSRSSPAWSFSFNLHAGPLPSIVVVKVDVGLAQEALCFGKLLSCDRSGRRAEAWRIHRRPKIMLILIVESSRTRSCSRPLRRRRRSCSARGG